MDILKNQIFGFVGNPWAATILKNQVFHYSQALRAAKKTKNLRGANLTIRSSRKQGAAFKNYDQLLSLLLVFDCQCKC